MTSSKGDSKERANVDVQRIELYWQSVTTESDKGDAAGGISSRREPSVPERVVLASIPEILGGVVLAGVDGIVVEVINPPLEVSVLGCFSFTSCL